MVLVLFVSHIIDARSMSRFLIFSSCDLITLLFALTVCNYIHIAEFLGHDFRDKLLRHSGTATFSKDINSCFIIVSMRTVSRRIRLNRRLHLYVPTIIIRVLSRAAALPHSTFLIYRIDRIDRIINRCVLSASPR